MSEAKSASAGLIEIRIDTGGNHRLYIDGVAHGPVLRQKANRRTSSPVPTESELLSKIAALIARSYPNLRADGTPNPWDLEVGRMLVRCVRQFDARADLDQAWNDPDPWVDSLGRRCYDNRDNDPTLAVSFKPRSREEYEIDEMNRATGSRAT